MSITKITKNAFPASIDLSSVDLTIGNDEIVTANIADNNVTHAKLHTDMDLSSKTVTLPTISSLTVSSGTTHLDGRNSAGLTLDLAGTGHYTIKEHTTDDIVKLGGTGSVNFIAHNISSGNVGIGQAAPDARLDLGTLNSSTAGSNQMFQLGAFGYRHEDTGGYNHLYLERNYGGWQTTPMMTFKADGKVGIGTASPSETLEVNGAIKIDTGAGHLRFNHDAQNGAIFNVTGNLLLYAQGDQQIIFHANSTQQLLIDDTRAEFKGNVGIGTASPSAPLHVRETVSDTISPATAVAKLDGSGSDGIAFGNTQSSPFASWMQAGYLADGYSPAFNNGYPIYLNPIGGDVTVGAASNQNAKFTAKKSSVVYGKIGTSTNGHYFESQSDDGTDGFEIYQQHGSTTGRNSFIVNDNRTGSKSAAFTVRGDGRVGIGTESLSEELHIYNSTNDPYVLVDGSGSNRDSGYKINAGNGVKIMARADAAGAMYFADNAIGIIPTSGNDQYRTALFDSEIQVGGLYGSGNKSRVVLARVYEARDLDWPSGHNVNTSETDTITGVSYSRPSSAGNSTGFFGPYGQLPAGSYTALFRMKIADNSSTSYMGFIDVTGTGITNPSGQNPRPRLQNISPSLFTASNRYQYIALDFENTSNTGYIETRYIDFVTGVGTFYLDHILIVPRLNHN